MSHVACHMRNGKWKTHLRMHADKWAAIISAEQGNRYLNLRGGIITAGQGQRCLNLRGGAMAAECAKFTQVCLAYARILENACALAVTYVHLWMYGCMDVWKYTQRG